MKQSEVNNHPETNATTCAAPALGGGCTVAMIFASVFAALAVGLGAFGAHALNERLVQSGMLDVWQTAVQYQMWHAAALLGLGVWVRLEPACASCLRRAVAMLWVAGIILFSGSLYWLALGGPKWLGPVTPLGGLCFIIGWLLLALCAVSLLKASNRR